MNQISKSFAVALLRAYKSALSPVFSPACRYIPTCSEYAMQAVENHGTLHGGWMSVKRVLRCHPLAKSGYDPVKPKDSRAR
jgi:putative membrane protein insertion efficiency factor